ncbi:MAG: MBL fold hydrolase [Alphaproteobacteria bacterium]|nr:MAG: MBL fold hydrolase [Alphaproteobacteria bacterium]
MTDRPGDDELLFLALGGAGEIGMNLNLYGHAGKWLMIDLGITFGDERTPGIEVIMPDPGFIAERLQDLSGLVLTHAHEDHLGAVPYLWPRLRCPVYATPFTAAVLHRKLKESGLAGEVPIETVPMSGRFSVGPFDLELVTLTHSIPEPNAIVVRTRAGTVLHTGDWKFDPDPLVGPASDQDALRRIGEEGVLAMVCDSTNALVEGQSGSEADVRDNLVELIGRYDTRVAVACFASNVARVESIAKAAAAHDRQVALVGRSLWRIVEAARETGYLTDLPEFVTEHDVGYLPRDKVVMICTGSQGERRSALARIARRDHPNVSLEPGDVAVFSSRKIPGNEREIAELQNDLVRLGVHVVTDDDHFVHVSGHPGRDELTEMYQLVRPRIAVPVHGESRHLAAHAKLAQACQVAQAVIPENGAVIRLAPGPAEIVAEVPAGRLGLDGTNLVGLDAGRLKARHRMVFNGAAVATLVLDRQGRLAADPQVTVQGVYEAEDQDAGRSVLAAVRDAVDGLPPALRRDDGTVREAARLAIRRALHASHGKKPVTDVHLVRI